MDEVYSVSRAKITYAQSDSTLDPEEGEFSGQRTKRLNPAYEAIEKVRQGR